MLIILLGILSFSCHYIIRIILLREEQGQTTAVSRIKLVKMLCFQLFLSSLLEISVIIDNEIFSRLVFILALSSIVMMRIYWKHYDFWLITWVLGMIIVILLAHKLVPDNYRSTAFISSIFSPRDNREFKYLFDFSLYHFLMTCIVGMWC